ncbi:MAG: hypothetical protein ACLR5Q_08405 [Coprococcus sp.]
MNLSEKGHRKTGGAPLAAQKINVRRIAASDRSNGRKCVYRGKDAKILKKQRRRRQISSEGSMGGGICRDRERHRLSGIDGKCCLLRKMSAIGPLSVMPGWSGWGKLFPGIVLQ